MDSSKDELERALLALQQWQKISQGMLEYLERRITDTSDEEGTDSDEENELVSAAESGDVNALRLALENYEGNIDDPMEDGDTLLHLTCQNGHLNCVKFLLEKGSNLEAKNEDEGIPLHNACGGGYTEIIQLIITHANEPKCVTRMLETVDTKGDTPLHHAARGRYVDVIRLLLAHGASTSMKNINGETPLEIADSETEAWRVLKEAMANG